MILVFGIGMKQIETVVYENFPIKLTKKAIEISRAYLKKNKRKDFLFLRVSVYGGGCSGLKYGLNFTEDLTLHDLVTETLKLKIVVDIFSAIFLTQASIDYVIGKNGSGFKFFTSKSTGHCACPSSE